MKHCNGNCLGECPECLKEQNDPKNYPNCEPPANLKCHYCGAEHLENNPMCYCLECYNGIKENKATFPETEKYLVEEKGKKYDEGKPRTDLLPPLALMEVAKVMAFGAKKYGDHNWRGGLRYSRLGGACLRHIYAFLSGQDADDETGISHLAHASCCILMLLEFVVSKRTDLDDRYKEKK